MVGLVADRMDVHGALSIPRYRQSVDSVIFRVRSQKLDPVI